MDTTDSNIEMLKQMPRGNSSHVDLLKCLLKRYQCASGFPFTKPEMNSDLNLYNHKS